MQIFQLSLAAAPLIAAIILIRTLFKRRLPKKTFLALWCVALCRLLLPFSIPSRLNIASMIQALRALWPQAAPPPIIAAPTQMAADILGIAPAVEAAELAGHPLHLAAGENIAVAAPSLLLWLWLAGMLACTLFFLFTHLRGRMVYQTARPVEHSLARQWLAAHPIRRTVRIKQSDELASPLTYGIVRPVILLPHNLDWQNQTQLEYILTHEYVHIRRFDTLSKWLLAIALCAHWFNPLVWAMYVLANRDMELACDETVLRIYGEKAKSAYARTLISLEEKRSKLQPLCNNFSKNSIEERIVSIMKIKKNTLIGMLAGLAVVVAVAIVFASSATPREAAAAAPEATRLELWDTLIAEEAKSWEANPYPEGYMEPMLFVSKGEGIIKATYDSQTWELYDATLEKQNWRWYTYAEYEAEMSFMLATLSADATMPQENIDRAKARYEQTLADIQNGIKVSKCKIIHILDPGPQSSNTQFNNGIFDPAITWYCFGYSFTDKAGKEVDLGLFESRDQLFAAVKAYYDAEVAAGRISQAEADKAYNKIAHSVRFKHEVPLTEELLINYEQYM